MGDGTIMARQKADMVLTDGDFGDCMRGIMYGRNIYTNIKRFLMFQITINFSVLIFVFVGYCYLTQSPLNSVQLLWINLIMDTFAALALATMPPLTSVLDEPPIVSDTSVLTKTTWRQIYGVTIWNVIVMMVIMFAGKKMFDLEYTNATQMTTRNADGSLSQAALDKREHFTIMFNTFVWLCWFNEWNCRVVGPKEFNFLKNFFASWMYLFVMLGVAVAQWSSCKWLFWIFGNEKLDAQVYFRCVAWGFTVIPVALLLKLTPERWVDRIPVGISEEKALGQNTFIMKGYNSVNQQRKISLPKRQAKN